MSEDNRGMTRRAGLKLIASGLAVGAVGGTGSVSADGHIDATITINNVGVSAYEVTSTEGDIRTNTGVNNPTITLTDQPTNNRYRVVNDGYPGHPLQLENENGDALLSQDGSGSFENDDAVNWVNNDDSVQFTLTTELATEIDTYRCTTHVNAMVGSITAELPDYSPSAGSVSFTEPDDRATVTEPVTFEMTAENFTVEAASNGVRDGAGHLHILVDQPAYEPGEVIPNNEANGYYHYGGGQTSVSNVDLDPGDHTVRVQAGDAKHRAYELTDTIQITMSGIPGAEPATNTDDDEKLEDVNGDGTSDFNDAIDLAFDRDSDGVSGNPLFDFDGDGDVDFDDAIALAFENSS